MLLESILIYLSKDGVIASSLALDFLLLLMLVTVAKLALVPAFLSYRKCRYIDQSLGSDKRHWFYGHLFKVRGISFSMHFGVHLITLNDDSLCYVLNMILFKVGVPSTVG